jgi:pimeloyl-ACP methyl ester carboxylesterase
MCCNNYFFLLFRIIGFMAIAMLLGCAEKIGLQPIDEDKWFQQQSRSSLSSDIPSEFTLRFLRKEDLLEPYEKDPVSVLISLESEAFLQSDRDSLFALMELCYAEAKKTATVSERTSRFYLSSVRYAYTFLFDQELKPALNTYSPRFRWACDFYNRSLAKYLIYCKEHNIRAKAGSKLQLINGELCLAEVQNGLSWDLQELSQFDVAYNYKIKGLRNHYRSSGLGVPLILVRDLPSKRGRDIDERFMAQNHQICPGSAVLHFKEAVTDDKEGGSCLQGRLEIYDSVQTSEIPIGTTLIPLELDFTTPIAYSLENTPDLKGTTGFFEPEAWTDACGLYMISPYQPEKIPVVFVHGLFTTTRTWTVMLNELAGDPLLREKYQAWFFLYPTGNPIIFNATLLRDSLLEVRQVLDPAGVDEAFDQMVIVGHSMGGLLSKIMVQHSSHVVWDYLFDKPIDELDIREDERELLEELLFFEPLPFVKRVVFMATPHRGTELAKSRLNKIGLSFVKLPNDVTDFVMNVTPFFKEEHKTHPNYPKKRVPTGFHGLRSDSGYSVLINEIPIDPAVSYHSIIGNKDAADTPGGSDGIVTYESAHLEGAVSEKIVCSNHNVHTSPAGILEVRRILHEHIP